MNTVEVKPELIFWAINRSGIPIDILVNKFPKIRAWGKEGNPTLKQLENFAKITLTPFGYFFLPNPPEDNLPIPDCRTIQGVPVQQPSPNLIETIQIMQRRQVWMHDFLIEQGEKPLNFIDSISLSNNTIQAANNIRDILGLNINWAKESNSWTNALTFLNEAVEKIGILTVFNGVVENNTHRILNVEEFRGFILVDQYAPLIFINNSDAKAAQMFTFVHELAHLWLGANGVVNFRKLQPYDNDIEKFCDRVAAEFLVPEKQISESWPKVSKLEKPFHELALDFKVSPIVCARRALDLGFIEKSDFFEFYNTYLENLRNINEKSYGGGNFYNTQNARIGRRFARAINHAIKEGKLLYHDAYRLTGLNGKTFDAYMKIIS